jgi:CheY-like chemotaxis protein
MTLEILLVEDEVDQVYLVTRALQRWLSPYNLHTVSTAEEALDFINRRNGYANAPTLHIISHSWI